MGLDIFRYYLAKIFINKLCSLVLGPMMGSHSDPGAQRAHTFPARFLNIFVDYPLGQMRVGDKLWMNWNKAPLKL